ncbi:ABC transporter ATP-binding protein [Nocardia thailandica]|uniref:ABC transporter ATP-binding protein n=1 Tax=Nocardia thailandica TaxID=257275 RepID=A0ABW6PJG1_9NOCA
MTVEEAPLPAARAGNRPPREAAKAKKQAEALARQEIMAPVRAPLLIASLLTVLVSAATVVPFVLVVEACRELLDDPIDTDRVWRLFLLAALVLAGRAVLQAVILTGTHLVDGGFQLAVRRRLARKLSRVPLGWFGEHTSGEVKKYLRDDVEALHYLVAHARVDFVGALTVPLITLVYLFAVEWRLALVLLLPVLGYALLFGRMMDRDGRDRVLVYNRAEERTQQAVIEFVDGIGVVRAFGQAGKAHGEFQAAVDHQARAVDRMKTPIIGVQSASDIVVMPVFVMLLVVVFGLAFVGLDWVSPLDLLPFLLVGLGIGSSLLGLSYAGQTLRSAREAALRLHGLLAEPELAAGAEESAPLAGPATVRFENVSFGYRADREVLRGVDLELAAGTLTALVGPSGSGKSTLAKLLPRFYDVTGGRITIGGRDIRDFTSEQLYRTVGFVFQDVRLIRGSIRDNLLPARRGASDQDLERAARAAQIHDRILALPRGYDSEIGVDATLSGGEAQRLSIARALLADTPVLVLDEATAFADPESEAAVQDALAALVAGRTVLVIAHRLHTITGADRIVVLADGAVAESGTHADLHVAGGLYQRLWETNEAALGDLALIDTAEGAR